MQVAGGGVRTVASLQVFEVAATRVTAHLVLRKPYRRILDTISRNVLLCPLQILL